MSSMEMPKRRPSIEQLESLLNELQEHTRAIRESWQAGEVARLKVLANQLASVAAGSGNRAVTEMAAQLEAVLLAEEAEASAMCERIEELIRQCKKAAAGSNEGR